MLDLASVGTPSPLARIGKFKINRVMRIIVTGATGFLGRAVVEAALRRGHDVLAVGGKNTLSLSEPVRFLQLNLCDEVKLQSLMLEEFPQAVINCAGLTKIDACAENEKLAQDLNEHLPRLLAQLAFHVGGKLIHFSTDMVFDGQRGKYEHTDQPAPLSVYAKTKAAGEIGVLNSGREHSAVIRTSILNGNSFQGQTSLHERLFHQWSQGIKTPLFTDEIRQPVSCTNMADVAVELCERPNLSGVYHWAGLEAISRDSIGRKIAEYFGLNPDKYIESVTRNAPTIDPQRPRNLSMLLHPLAGKLRTPAQTFGDQLGELRVPRGCEDWYEKETGRKVVRLLQKGLDF